MIPQIDKLYKMIPQIDKLFNIKNLNSEFNSGQLFPF